MLLLSNMPFVSFLSVLVYKFLLVGVLSVLQHPVMVFEIHSSFTPVSYLLVVVSTGQSSSLSLIHCTHYTLLLPFTADRYS